MTTSEMRCYGGMGVFGIMVNFGVIQHWFNDIKPWEETDELYDRLTCVVIEGLPILGRNLVAVKSYCRKIWDIGQPIDVILNKKSYPVRIFEEPFVSPCLLSGHKDKWKIKSIDGSIFEEEVVGPSMEVQDEGDSLSGDESPGLWADDSINSLSPNAKGINSIPPVLNPAHSSNGLDFVKPILYESCTGPDVPIVAIPNGHDPLPDLNAPTIHDEPKNHFDLDLDELLSSFQRISDNSNIDPSAIGGRKRKHKKKNLVVGEFGPDSFNSQSNSIGLEDVEATEFIDDSTIRSIWPRSFVDYAFSCSTGASGGILTMWDSCVFSLDSKIYDRNFVVVVGSWAGMSSKIRLINVYAPQANRLVKVISLVIGPNQTAFIAGRQILDGCLIANEIIRMTSIEKSNLLLFKVDFEKAFDSVNWNFLQNVMRQMGFGVKWRKWITYCLSSASISILINGSPTKEFKLERGLRQGDPLSPFLFLIVVEALQISILEACEKGFFKGIHLANNGANISLLQYADDALFFGDWSRTNAMYLIHILKCFELASGLKVNMSKSRLIGLGILMSEVENLANFIGCSHDFVPFINLGLLVGKDECQVIKDFYGDDGGLSSPLNSCGIGGTWCDILKAIENIEAVDNSFKNSFVLKGGNWHGAFLHVAELLMICHPLFPVLEIFIFLRTGVTSRPGQVTRLVPSRFAILLSALKANCLVVMLSESIINGTHGFLGKLTCALGEPLSIGSPLDQTLLFMEFLSPQSVVRFVKRIMKFWTIVSSIVPVCLVFGGKFGVSGIWTRLWCSPRSPSLILP
ncbi:putative RNA-directed DNA polymerase, eukaryota, reverse transcriptase zinc-binding domain protein [Tanacetum coccineum]|uniref:RNA-directed DNA polymerase, eukaryota, reverse transcriptase zinc-binding domain protein n=1 Tax=Tanacetum coccineum TaxID=301880 RepID=A0ABQ4ZW20_9ASTR